MSGKQQHKQEKKLSRIIKLSEYQEDGDADESEDDEDFFDREKIKKKFISAWHNVKYGEKTVRTTLACQIWLPICCKIHRLIYIDATGVILACFYSTGVILFVYLYSTKLLLLCKKMINFYSTKIAMIEWSRSFGLDVLVWGLDPNYNVFHNFF